MINLRSNIEISHAMNDPRKTESAPAMALRSRELVRPSAVVTEEMMHLARTDDLWHFAQNLNAMMRLGYCRTCGLVPSGCEREGCGPNDRDEPRES